MPSEYERGPSHPLAPGLYLVATPIGNLEDITLRALRILASVDRIACEDTRQTQKLLNHFDIHTPTVSYHMHNEATRAEELVGDLKQGARIAVVSDAGTPGIADPGGQLAAEAIASPEPTPPSTPSSPAASPPNASPSTDSFPPRKVNEKRPWKSYPATVRSTSSTKRPTAFWTRSPTSKPSSVQRNPSSSPAN